MNLEALRIELAKPEYEGLSDQEAADTINAKTVTIRQPVETWRVKQLAMEQGVWGKIKLAQQSALAPDEVKGLAITVIDWIDDPAGKIVTVDMDLAATQYMLAGLVAAGLCTQTQADAISNLANGTQPWTVANNLDVIGDGHVKSAREAIQ